MPATAPSFALARQADSAAIAALSRQHIEQGLRAKWTAERVAYALRRRDTIGVVARMEKILVGFAIMQFGADQAHLNLLAVAPLFRRRGIGGALIEWLEASAVVAGVSCITLELRAGNHAALAFYQCLGYEEFEALPRYYDRRESALRMMHVLRYPDWTAWPAGGTRRDASTGV
jgi:ribosomal-protein-alanine N-acetyltransferase